MALYDRDRAVTDKNRSQWDISRFWQTLTYFEVIPLVSCLQRLFKGTKSQQANLSKQISMETILVVGATSGVFKQVVDSLLAQNYRVKAIVEDNNQISGSIAPSVELLTVDLDNPTSLTTQMTKGVDRIIYLDTVENSVGWDRRDRQISNLIQVASNSLTPATDKILFDFTNPTTEIKETWGAVDDVVMGGVSQSSIRVAENRAVFSGFVSTDNNGGFASVRTRNFDSPLDLSDYEGIELRVQGDGKRYKFITRCEGRWDGIGYCYSFDTVYNYWTTMRIPFQDLIPVFRAKTVPDAGYFDSSKVYSMQLMLSKFEYDGGLNQKFEPGVFSLEVEYIKTYGGKPKSQFILLSSSNLSKQTEELLAESKLTYKILPQADKTSSEAIMAILRD